MCVGGKALTGKGAYVLPEVSAPEEACGKIESQQGVSIYIRWAASAGCLWQGIARKRK